MFALMDPAAEQRQLTPGTMLDDKYRVENLLAVGGMGAVYVGTHTKLRKRVAIKVLNPQLSTPQMIERFHREAITASQVGHEGIAQVTDLGTSAQGEPFLVMELLEGESLAKRLRRTGALPVEVACEMACSILAPLSAAHAAGIVHRDLKPDNVFLVQQSRGEIVKLLDFGISRAAGLDAESRLTTTGLVLGTPYYMSPEQAQGSTEITQASDLYSVGVILYELLIGKVPIHGDNYNQLMYHVITGAFVPPRKLRPELPAALERVVLRAMALWPADRPRSAAELEQALLPFCRATFRAHAIETTSGARHIGFQMPPPLPTPSHPAVGSGATSGAVYSSRPLTPLGSVGTDETMRLASSPGAAIPHPRRRWPWAVAALALAGAGVLAAVVVPRPATSEAMPRTVPEPVQPAQPPPSTPPTSAAPATPTEGATVTPPPVTPPPVTAPPAPATETIRLRFDLEPRDAQLSIDGKPVSGADLEVPKDGAEHVVRIFADGYQAEEQRVRFDETQRLVVRLVRESRATRRPRSEDRSPPTRDKPPVRIESDSPYR